MTKFYCDGCGVEISNCLRGAPMSEDFRFAEGIFCTACEARGIILKEEFIKEEYNLCEEYRKKLKKV